MLTDEAFARMIALGERFAQGVAAAIEAHGLPLARDPPRLPGRVPVPPDRRAPAARPPRRRPAARRLIHLYALNRGILLTPFHNMALMSPATTDEDVDRHTDVFAEATAAIAAAL